MSEKDDRPWCSGEYLSGSGGHRKHGPCGAPADWWHPQDMYAYCETHLVALDRADYVPWPWMYE